MAIPKIIHYCWLGNEPMPELVINCINSWKKILIDYELMLWNTDNFDVGICKYTKEAYATGKYAFVSDYIRLYALYIYGGIYLDTDIEVLKDFNELLNEKAFTGFQNSYSLATWILGSEKENPLFSEFLEHYDGKSFLLPNGEMDLTPNPFPITETCRKYNLIINNKMQKLKYITIYPQDYFNPYNHITGELHITENTYTIHYFNHSWFSEKQKIALKQRRKIISKYGKTAGYIYQLIYLLRNEGLRQALIEIKRVLKK